MERDKDGQRWGRKREIPVAPPRIISATRGKDHQASQPVIKRNFSLPLFPPFFLSLPFLFFFFFSFFSWRAPPKGEALFIPPCLLVENSCNIKYACTRLQKRFEGNLKHRRGRSWSNEWTDGYIYMYYICVYTQRKAVSVNIYAFSPR